MNKITLVLMTIVLGLGATGCAKKTGSAANGGADAGGVGDSMRFYGSNVSPETERQWLAKDTYYFGYDQYELSEEDTMSIYAHARKMAANGGHVRIEGHTDERGSREYNVALGDRRAKTIANLLMLKGVNQNQISLVSYGKEKPEHMGHDEASWTQNRRGNIAYE